MVCSGIRLLIATLLIGLVFPDNAPAQKEPNLSEEQMKQFLLTARVVASKVTPKGVTSPWRLTLTDGIITHDASFQSVDEFRDKQVFPDGHIEVDFWDCYKYDIAAYELAKLLGLGDMMPVTVERKWDGKTGAISWWLPAVMDVFDMNQKKINPPDPDFFNKQIYMRRVFAELVYDTDPNLTNVLISSDWRLWMIDFTRAFRPHKQLSSKSNITESRCERRLLEKLRQLDRNELALNTKGYLGKKEIDGIMARRNLIVALFDDMIAKKGEKAVLYDSPAVKRAPVTILD